MSYQFAEEGSRDDEGKIREEKNRGMSLYKMRNKGNNSVNKSECLITQNSNDD